tara:strand:+ start:273 stop:554 length:282 start_codon:yes stop_codon:yes gene_type:complete
MKPFLFLLSVSILSLSLASCGQSESDPSTSSAAAVSYPLDVCVVSGEKLGSMGEPIVVTHDGVTVKFCCDHCLPEFEKDPAKFVAKVTSASKE